MGPEHAIGQTVQLLLVWGPVAVVFVTTVRLLWRAGDRKTSTAAPADQQRLEREIAALSEEIHSLRHQLGLMRQPPRETPSV